MTHNKSNIKIVWEKKLLYLVNPSNLWEVLFCATKVWMDLFLSFLQEFPKPLQYHQKDDKWAQIFECTHMQILAHPICTRSEGLCSQIPWVSWNDFPAPSFIQIKLARLNAYAYDLLCLEKLPQVCETFVFAYCCIVSECKDLWEGFQGRSKWHLRSHRISGRKDFLFMLLIMIVKERR